MGGGVQGYLVRNGKIFRMAFSGLGKRVFYIEKLVKILTGFVCYCFDIKMLKFAIFG